MSKKLSNSSATWGIFALRIIVGAIFVIAGYGKLADVNGFAVILDNVGFPIGLTLAWIVALIELIGGAMLVLGFQTRKAAIPLGLIMVVALFAKVALGGFGGGAWNNLRLDLLLLAALIVFLGYGAGTKSIDTTATSSKKASTDEKKESTKDSKKDEKKEEKKSSKKKSSKKDEKKSSKKKSSSKKSSSKKK